MRVLLEYVFEHPSAEDLYGHWAEHLRRLGHRCRVVRSVRRARVDPRRFDFYLSHGVIPKKVRAATRSLGGTGDDRGTLLGHLERSGIPVVPWSRAANRHEVSELFDRWSTDLVLCKRSFTCGGEGVSVFRRGDLDELVWDVEHDVFCPELDAETGDTYKAEIFAGRLIISWRGSKPPLRERENLGAGTRLGRCRAERELCELPVSLVRTLESLSGTLTDHGYGYCSADFMRARDGTLTAIELNSERVATWWTSQFPFVRIRSAEAIATAIGVARSPRGWIAALAERMRHRRAEAVRERPVPTTVRENQS